MKNTTKIIAVFVVLVLAFVIYSKWDYLSSYVSGFFNSGSSKIFKVAGGDVGPYLSGENILAEKETFTKRDPKIGDIVVYQKNINGIATDVLGEIVGLPGSSYRGNSAPSGYYLIEKDEKIEVVARDKITWLVSRKVL